MSKLRKKRVFALLFLLLLAVLFFQSDWIAKWMHPISYKSEIREYSLKYGIDPFLVAAVIRVESGFKADNRSHKGAVGLMQLMPDTAKWLLEREGAAGDGDLLDPELNIKLGVQYLHFLQSQFSGNIAEMLAAYNAGHGNVAKWLENGIWDGRMDTIEQIPFKETRRYVASVYYYYQKYTEIYRDTDDW